MIRPANPWRADKDDALPPAICLMGPTATGKTELAVTLAAQLPVEIVSVDSALVYRGLDIGTAKPDAAVLARYPHHLIDIIEPQAAYSAGQFRQDALAALAAITAAGKVPLLVGGTGLYFRALERGLAPLPAAHPELRAALDAEAQTHGWAYLHQRLQAVDPAGAARIHPHDPQRIQRALEVYTLTGQPLSELQHAAGEALPYRLYKLGVLPRDRQVLQQRIRERFTGMLAAGLVGEVRALRELPGMHRELPAMRAVGYRQVWDYLDGNFTEAQMVEAGIKATRHLAKRQMTWLRREERLHIVWQETLQAATIIRWLAAFIDGTDGR